ncbi:MAG: SPFH domain-containing protein, partial [archaeon]
VEDYRQASTMYVIAALRDIIGDFELTEVITNIEKINSDLKQALIEIGKDWGIKVTSVELSEIKIPQDILEAMHQQKAAVQKKLAVYELAESEKAKILAVKDATDQLSDKTVIYYYLKALEKMAEGQSSKIIFPMELTSLLEKVTDNIGQTKGKLNPNALEKGINEKSLEKFLPFIQGYINSEKNKKKGKVIKKK